MSVTKRRLMSSDVYVLKSSSHSSSPPSFGLNSDTVGLPKAQFYDHLPKKTYNTTTTTTTTLPPEKEPSPTKTKNKSSPLVVESPAKRRGKMQVYDDPMVRERFATAIQNAIRYAVEINFSTPFKKRYVKSVLELFDKTFLDWGRNPEYLSLPYPKLEYRLKLKGSGYTYGITAERLQFLVDALSLDRDGYIYEGNGSFYHVDRKK